jgi:hypothetical protein
MSEEVVKTAAEAATGIALTIGVAYVLGKLFEKRTEGNVEDAAKINSIAMITSSLLKEGGYDIRNKDDLEKLKGTADYLLGRSDDILKKLKKDSE